MKVAFLLSAFLLAYASAQTNFVGSLMTCVCSFLEDIMPSTLAILLSQVTDLCNILEGNIPPSDPAYERIVYFKTWIWMKLDMIKGLIHKGKTIKDRFPDPCELAQFIKFYLCVLIEWLHQLRCEIRELDCFLVYRFGFRYVEQIRIILNTIDDMDLILVKITKCYKVFYYNTHCEGVPWVEGTKLGKAMGSVGMLSKDAGDAMVMTTAFDLLDNEIMDFGLGEVNANEAAIRNGMAGDAQMDNDTSDAMAEADTAGDDLDDEARAILTQEERQNGNMCDYTAEYRDFLCDLVIKKQVFRNKLRRLELFLKRIFGPAYKYSKYKRCIDRLYHLLFKIDYFILRIGMLYIDFFIHVHCDFNDCWCIIRGDPLVSTCDKALLFLQGEGWYSLARANHAPCKRFMVFVQVKLVYHILLPVKMVIYFRLGANNWVTITIVEDHDVFVDNVQINNFPHVISPGMLTLLGVGNQFNMVQTDCGYIAFWYEGHYSKGKVHLDNTFFGNVEGLCGDYDGIRSDDVSLSSGDNDGGVSSQMASLPDRPTD